MAINQKIKVQGTPIGFYKGNNEDYISLTDIARYKNSSSTDSSIQNWLRNRNTIELLGFWEQMYNPYFNPIEFKGFKKQAGLNRLYLHQNVGLK